MVCRVDVCVMWCAVMWAGLLTFLLGSWEDVSEPATESARDSAYVSPGVAWEVPCFFLIRLGTDLALAFPPLGCRMVAAAVGGEASSDREFATASRVAADRSTLAFLALALSWAAAEGTPCDAIAYTAGRPCDAIAYTAGCVHSTTCPRAC